MSDSLQSMIAGPDQESMDGLMLDEPAFERIKNLYIEQLIIPDLLPRRQFFLCPIGLVGAGKSTVIKPLAEQFHLVRVSTDEFRKLLGQQGYNSVRTAELAYSVISDFAKKGYSIAVDADCAGKGVRESISRAAQAINAKIAWIHINPPEDFILNKLRTIKHTWLFKDADDAVANYFRRKPLHQNLEYPFLYTFDTSRSDLLKQLQDAIRVIDDSLEGKES